MRIFKVSRLLNEFLDFANSFAGDSFVQAFVGIGLGVRRITAPFVKVIQSTGSAGAAPGCNRSDLVTFGVVTSRLRLVRSIRAIVRVACKGPEFVGHESRTASKRSMKWRVYSPRGGSAITSGMRMQMNRVTNVSFYLPTATK